MLTRLRGCLDCFVVMFLSVGHKYVLGSTQSFKSELLGEG